jgi:hypothetical protein
LTIEVDFGDYVLVMIAIKRSLGTDSKKRNIQGQVVSKGNSSRRRSELENSPARRPHRRIEPKRAPAARVEPSNQDVDLTLKHFNRRIEASVALRDAKRLYLKVGDEVNHLRYEEWGMGVVMEIMTSSVPGGTCLARVRFQDGQLRCFNNDLDNEACCYYFGVRRYWNPTHGVDAIRSKLFFGG